MKRIGTLVAAAWLAMGTMATAGETVVVELFTSQGCSSCPPADRILGELSERDDIIALAFHVDYWDYLGWKDKFASPQNTRRQRNYARAKGERTIYTPQMIIGGTDPVVGSKSMKVGQLVQKHAEKKMPVHVRLTRNGNTVRIASASRSPVGKAIIQLVTFSPKSKVEVKRGENAGKTFVYHNIVRSLDVIGTWDGTGTHEATVQVPAGLSIAVLVQQRGFGPILGAAQLR